MAQSTAANLKKSPQSVLPLLALFKGTDRDAKGHDVLP